MSPNPSQIITAEPDLNQDTLIDRMAAIIEHREIKGIYALSFARQILQAIEAPSPAMTAAAAGLRTVDPVEVWKAMVKAALTDAADVETWNRLATGLRRATPEDIAALAQIDESLCE